MQHFHESPEFLVKLALRWFRVLATLVYPNAFLSVTVPVSPEFCTSLRNYFIEQGSFLNTRIPWNLNALAYYLLDMKEHWIKPIRILVQKIVQNRNETILKLAKPIATFFLLQALHPSKALWFRRPHRAYVVIVDKRTRRCLGQKTMLQFRGLSVIIRAPVTVIAV